ncbi:hypothetical protein B0T21DRAFT_136529 [Apiosordaria backusii]|uniref:Uncharacterized protein n=1 Tax=Apiosordaria backusii TaxID=314023 RepID=A0AA40BRI2_9PEZI|nr:hypothetical protein B0T21DRAFT_136529 [Apiosordaria backusii]
MVSSRFFYFILHTYFTMPAMRRRLLQLTHTTFTLVICPSFPMTMINIPIAANPKKQTQTPHPQTCNTHHLLLSTFICVMILSFFHRAIKKRIKTWGESMMLNYFFKARHGQRAHRPHHRHHRRSTACL